MRKVGICGLGYVGCVTAACIARNGHEVVGLDIIPTKVAMVARGEAPFVEPGLGELLASAAGDGRLHATTDFADAVGRTEAMILCVGTPTADDGSPDLSHLADAAAKIGAALRGHAAPYTVMVRSTVPPGTIEEIVIPALERTSRRLVGADGLAVVVVPEFLRETTAIADFDDPPFVAVGGPLPPSPEVRRLVEDLFPFPGKHRWIDTRTAELLKCVCNAFHATKTVFANEVGALCSSLGIDGVALMALLVEDRKLNASAAYLRPGEPFGGSCLPKDLRALLHLSKQVQQPSLLLRATLESNELHIARTIALVEQLGVRRIGIDGLAFKPGTDDLRESPMVAIAEALLERGCEVRIFDPAVLETRAHGPRSKARLLAALVETPHELLRHAELILLRGASPGLLALGRAMGVEPLVLKIGGLRVDRLDAPPAAVSTSAAMA